jgi:hypothetical protein
MRWIAPAIAVAVCLFVPGPTSAQIGGEAALVRGWYRDYLGSDATPELLQAWVTSLQGGMSPVDVQASILGSNEFFLQQGRDPQTFVLETLQSVTWSEPTVSDLRRWTDRLNQLQGDRYRLAREIIQHYVEPQPRNEQVADLAARLMSAARLVVDTVNFEIAGTSQGRTANLQGQSLLAACQQFQETVSKRNYSRDEALLALHNASRSHQSLQTTLNNPPGSALSSAGIARRIGTMLTEARTAIGPASNTTARPTTPATPTTPTRPTTPVVHRGYDQAQLLESVGGLMRAVQSLNQLLTSQAYQSYSYTVVLRDLDTFAAQVEAFQHSANQSAARDRLHAELAILRQSAARIAPQLRGERQPYFVRLYWQSIESSLEQMRVTLGAPDDAATVLRPTALHENLLPLLDHAVAQIDVFLAGTNHYVVSIPDVPAVQTSCRSIRSRLLTMRQLTAEGQPASTLKQTLSQMVGDYQQAFDRWNQTVASYRLINPARLSPVGETLNQVERLINEAVAGGQPAAEASRIGQVLALVSTEVTEGRRGAHGVCRLPRAAVARFVLPATCRVCPANWRSACSGPARRRPPAGGCHAASGRPDAVGSRGAAPAADCGRTGCATQPSQRIANARPADRAAGR